MSNLHVIPVQDSDLCWPFDNSQPYFSTVHGTYGSSERVDPFPCYAHDHALVSRELARVDALFPLDVEVYIYVSPFEGVGRTNAHASPGYDYNAEQENGEYPMSTGTIVLSGKRIPLHPAMTRYLVAHEYGHLVEYRLKRAGLLDMKAYAELRGADSSPAHYGGRTWHRTTGEIFANDFRILVAEREEEFWPHECATPRSIPQLIAWWEETRSAFSAVLNNVNLATLSGSPEQQHVRHESPSTT